MACPLPVPFAPKPGVGAHGALHRAAHPPPQLCADQVGGAGCLPLPARPAPPAPLLYAQGGGEGVQGDSTALRARRGRRGIGWKRRPGTSARAARPHHAEAQEGLRPPVPVPQLPTRRACVQAQERGDVQTRRERGWELARGPRLILEGLADGGAYTYDAAQKRLLILLVAQSGEPEAAAVG
ncbi:hypothetical protein EI94DRAFT_1807830 [Lactarius quietus]|nr:hypothetical protein EI94DRAFT_1807830 [Lactarius quietus]